MILTLDPAYRNTGYAVMSNDGIVLFGVISPPYKSKNNIETFRNLHYIARELEKILETFPINSIYSEQMSGSRSQRAAMLLGAVDAIVITLAVAYSKPLIMVNERIVKKVLFGSRKVSKEKVMETFKEKYKELKQVKAKTILEHITDSLAVYHAVRRIIGGEYETYMPDLYIQGTKENPLFWQNTM